MSKSGPEHATEPSIVTMELRICTLCLDGKEGECHSPGCMFWMCPAITSEQGSRLRDWAFTDIAVANPEVFRDRPPDA